MNFVAEIFGYPPTNKSSSANNCRDKHICPFQTPNTECDPINKKSNLTDTEGRPLLTHQTGACSVSYKFKGYQDASISIICPYRFLEKNTQNQITVFKHIQEVFFPDEQLLFIPEVGLGAYGRADWIICQYETKETENLEKWLNLNTKLPPKIVIKDFAHVEFQSDATTNTRELVLCVKEFFEGEEIQTKNYRFGLNSKASIKSSSLQMIDKGYLFQKLGKLSLWVMHEPLFKILCKVYNIKMRQINKYTSSEADSLFFIITTFEHNKIENTYKLKIKASYSTSASDIQQAISEKDIFSESDIIRSLYKRIEEKRFILP